MFGGNISQEVDFSKFQEFQSLPQSPQLGRVFHYFQTQGVVHVPHPCVPLPPKLRSSRCKPQEQGQGTAFVREAAMDGGPPVSCRR
eukprot:760982-Hanusia_phi.AAC.1